MHDLYDPSEIIGFGEFSVVSKAHARKKNLTVAVKRLIQGKIPDSEWSIALAEFHYQANAATRLLHRNIVKTFKRGKDKEGSFAVMELIEGPNLAEYLKRKGGRLSPAEAVLITLGVAHALFYANKCGISHGRIRPSNILMKPEEQNSENSPQATPVVSGFCLGIIKIKTKDAVEGSHRANLYYMPPEQIENAGRCDFASDVYALGKILFELVSGETTDQINTDKIPNTWGLADVIINCTKSNPLDRYSTPEILIESLANIGQRPSTSIPLAKADEKPCPICGMPNESTARFCMACSSALIRFCPECGSEETGEQRSCQSCGTDIEVFIKYSDGIASMKRWAEERRWQNIVDCHETLPQPLKMQGEHGLETQKRALALRDLAMARLGESNRLEKTTRAFFANGELELALASATEALQIDPQSREPKDGESSLKVLADSCDTLITLLKSAQFHAALKTLEKLSERGFSACIVDVISEQINKDKIDYYEKLNTASSLLEEKQIAAANEMLTEMARKWPHRAEVLVQADLAERLHYNFEVKIRQAQNGIDTKSWKTALKAARIAVSIDPTQSRAADLLSQAAEGYYRSRRNRNITLSGILLFVFSIWLAARGNAIANNKRLYAKAVKLAERSNYIDAISVYDKRLTINSLLVYPPSLPDNIKEKAILQRESEFASLLSQAIKAKEAHDWFSCFTLSGKALALNIGESRDVTIDKWTSSRNIAIQMLENETMIQRAGELKDEAQKNLIKVAPDMSIKLSFVDAGTFMMGSNDGEEDERPVREIHMNSYFWISKHEITNQDYNLFVSKTGYDGTPEADSNYLLHKSGAVKLASADDAHPVVYVSWKNAVRFCKWMTEREIEAGRLPANLVYRLPTEAEWEFAARGGILSQQSKFSGSDSVNEVAWHIGNSSNGTSQVGLKTPNELGVFDMSGNVWEWCHDWYGNYDPAESSNPVGPETGSTRVCRGGSCLYLAANSRIANRYNNKPHLTDSSLGFRVVIARPIP